ncbi:MAG TPA: family 43 glycosylhydrolase, partial [Telluria sp.]
MPVPSTIRALLAGLALAASLGARAQTAEHQPPAGTFPGTYRNPLPLRLASGELAQNCADPAVLRDPQASRPSWYLYCTSDPVSKRERDQAGWHVRLVPIYRSRELVHWDFVADAFNERPPGLAALDAGLSAPEPAYLDGRYYLYFT